MSETFFEPSEQRQLKVVIVGAGAGGISTAARLAKAGIHVTVLEKNSFPGGRCSLIHHEGYRFDQGPSLLLLPNLVHSTFDDLGTSLDKESVKVYKCEPNYKVYFHDRKCVTLSTDQSLMKNEIEKWEGSEGYERIPGHPSISVRTVSEEHSPSIPYDAPGLYSLLQYTELTEGVWYPKGGFHEILKALIKISKKDGAIYRLSTPVDKVLVSNGKATGVRLSSGEDIQADIVVLNSDLVYSYQNLIPPQPLTLLDVALSLIPFTLFSRLLGSTNIGLGSRDVSCSSISFYWGMKRIIPEFGPHNVFLAERYRESFDDIFKSHTLPKEPSFYVNVPSRIDPTAAPEEKDSFVVLVPIGAFHKGKNQPRMEELVERARNFVIDRIEKQYNFKDFRQWIDFELINTPETCQD
ncbi:hypothetical protein Clacol_004882 [Clathrus columnatus]|uniref:Phytoene desaturase n=1 Tax=Clathrus columnatus TaxID=1419009 RepID=A0AAV5ACL5_9AGAM|nr:hypothetical protein Clacol_004882 [Clathrus columnatus]